MLLRVLYPVFLASCTSAAVLGVLMIWGLEPSPLLFRVLGTCVVVAVATALALSASRVVRGQPPEDDVG